MNKKRVAELTKELLIEMGEDPKKVLDDLNVKRYCCRRMLISHIDLIDELLKFKRISA